MQLYYIPMSTYSQKAVIALHEKGIEFEPKFVNLMDADANAAYRELYPVGKVPLLIPKPDYMVPESTSIIEYLEDHYPDQGTQLIPRERHAARKVRFTDRMVDLYMLNHSGFLFFQSRKPEAERDHDRVADAKRQLDIALGYMDKQLAGQPWAGGEEFSMADCAALPALGLARVSHPFEQFTNVATYFERGSARPSVKKAFDEGAPMLAQFMSAA